MKRILIVVMTTCFACCTSQVARAQALLNQVSWEQLPGHLVTESVPLLELMLSDCPPDVESLTHVRTVAQYIENTFYLWDEYELSNEFAESQRCLMMKKPHQQPLTSQQAQILLTASDLWSMRREIATISRRRHNSVGLFSVIGDDDRTRILDTQVWPWNTYCFLMQEYSEIGTFRATGFIVSPHMILTCAHATYDRDRGVRPDAITVIPALSGDLKPFGQIEALESCFDPRYPTSSYISDQPYEVGAVFFDAGDQLTGIHTWAPITFSTQLSIGDMIAVAGYPGKAHGSDSQYLWDCAGKIVDLQGHVIAFDADVSPGQSGSPLRNDAGDIVGVCFGEVPEENRAVILDSHNAQMIQQWMQWTPTDVAPASRPLEAPILLHGVRICWNERGWAHQDALVDLLPPTGMLKWRWHNGPDQPTAIEVGRTLSCSLYMPIGRPLRDLEVCLDLTHSQLEAIRATLFAPDGTRVKLFDSIDSDAGPDFKFHFADQALSDIQSVGTGERNRVRPDDPLAVFNGRDLHGTWILEIEDNRNPTTMWAMDDYVVGWGLRVAVGAPFHLFECATDTGFDQVWHRSAWTRSTWWRPGSTGTDASPPWSKLWSRVKGQPLKEIWTQTNKEGFETGHLNDTWATEYGDVILRHASVASELQAEETAGSFLFDLPPFHLKGRYGGMVLVKCERPVLLEQAMAYLEAASGIGVQFLVYESEAEGGPYKRVYMGPTQDYAAIEDSYVSEQINVSMQPGRFYSVGIASEKEVAIHCCLLPGDISFGMVIGGALSDMPMDEEDGSRGPAIYHPGKYWRLVYPRFTLFTKPVSFVSTGILESPALDPTELASDCVVYFGATVPEGTALTIDLVDAVKRDHIIKSHVELGGLISTDGDVPIRLRATLATADPNITPVLHRWSISRRDPSCESPWSDIMMEESVYGDCILHIAGWVRTTSGAPLPGVTLTVSNGGGVATTDMNGYYTLVIYKGWSGTITPSKAGYTFSPTSHSFNHVTSDRTLEFQADAIFSVISGRITESNMGLAGVTISASNGGGSTTTDSSGYYSLSVPFGWSGTVTAMKDGYTFTPASRAFNNVVSDQTLDFSASIIAPERIVFGYVMDEDSAAISGVTITASNGGGSVKTDASGYYRVSVPVTWSGLVTPTKDGYRFYPDSRWVWSTDPERSRDFWGSTSVADPTISGCVTGTIDVLGVTITASNGGSSTTTDASGCYSLTVPFGWSGTLTPSKEGVVT